MSEPTKGPWTHDGQGMYICDSAGNMVAEVRGWGHLSVTLGEERAFEVQRANGDLIAAAPTMHATIARLTSELAEARAERDRERTTAGALRQCVRGCDIFARAAMTMHGLGDDIFLMEAQIQLEKIEALTAQYLEPGYVGRVVTQEYEFAAQSAELADLRKRLSEATVIVDAADRWVACTTMNEADDAGSALEDLLAARREQSATRNGESAT